MSLSARITVGLDRQYYERIVNFSLVEKVGQHSEFTLVMRARDLEDNLGGVTMMESSRYFLGKSFTAQIASSDKVEQATYHFKGIITDVHTKKGERAQRSWRPYDDCW